MWIVENSVEYVDKYPKHASFQIVDKKCIHIYVNHYGKSFKTNSILTFTRMCYNK